MFIVVSALLSLLFSDMFLTLLGCVVAVASVIFVLAIVSPIPSGTLGRK